ncbi:hypothetical protein AB0O47_39865 [Streptomyces noursei]|uniref:hypothetical protein n=1 Tax=Streptomyces noursei TaxID=1971 RepID=UPI00344DC21B
MTDEAPEEPILPIDRIIQAAKQQGISLASGEQAVAGPFLVGVTLGVMEVGALIGLDRLDQELLLEGHSKPIEDLVECTGLSEAVWRTGLLQDRLRRTALEVDTYCVGGPSAPELLDALIALVGTSWPGVESLETVHRAQALERAAAAVGVAAKMIEEEREMLREVPEQSEVRGSMLGSLDDLFRRLGGPGEGGEGQ